MVLFTFRARIVSGAPPVERPDEMEAVAWIDRATATKHLLYDRRGDGGRSAEAELTGLLPLVQYALLSCIGLSCRRAPRDASKRPAAIPDKPLTTH
jgi:hypothetical protein